MQVEQISVFLENKSGRLAEVTRCLAEAEVNIRALSLADTSDFGILRLIVHDPALAKGVLREKGFTVGLNNVVAVEVPDHPGGLDGILTILENADVNVEYMYAYVRPLSSQAVLIFRFDKTDEALVVLQKENVKIIPGDTIYNS